MMAALFLVFSLAILLVITGQRKPAMVMVAIGILLSALMLWHHATDYLKINL